MKLSISKWQIHALPLYGLFALAFSKIVPILKKNLSLMSFSVPLKSIQVWEEIKLPPTPPPPSNDVPFCAAASTPNGALYVCRVVRDKVSLFNLVVANF